MSWHEHRFTGLYYTRRVRDLFRKRVWLGCTAHDLECQQAAGPFVDRESALRYVELERIARWRRGGLV